MSPQVFGFIMTAVGLLFCAVAWLNWGPWLGTRKRRFLPLLVGRNGARAVYTAVGVVFLLVGILSIAGWLPPPLPPYRR